VFLFGAGYPKANRACGSIAILTQRNEKVPLLSWSLFGKQESACFYEADFILGLLNYLFDVCIQIKASTRVLGRNAIAIGNC
jgi:hypothetical protein